MSAIVRFCVHPLTRSSLSRTGSVGGRGSLEAIASHGASGSVSGSAARSAVVRGAWRCGAHGGPTELGAALAAQLSKPGGRTTAGDLAADFRDSLTPPGRFLTPLTPIPAAQLQADEVVDDRSVDWRYEVLAASAQPSQPVRVRVLTKQQAEAASEPKGSVTRRSIEAWDDKAAPHAASQGPSLSEADSGSLADNVEEAAHGVGALAPGAAAAAAAKRTSSAPSAAGMAVAAFPDSAMDFIELD